MITWILESNVFAEECFDRMVDHLKERSIDYKIVRIIPFVHEIEGKIPKVNDKVVVYGSIGSQKLAEREGWSPGVWTGKEFSEGYCGCRVGDLYLNYDMIICPISQALDHAKMHGLDEFFIKPHGDTKEFAGHVITANDFQSWYDKLISIGYLSDNDFEVAISMPKAVHDEFRLIIVDGKVSSGTLYKRYGRGYSQPGYPEELNEIVSDLDKKFRPAPVYAIDFGATDMGWKVIEYNTFNSAGLYACDVGKIIDDINQFVE